ncbi:MAG: hypothetical protein ILO68_08495, partial [Clostridia bacterium]|nr:hypothetical protein [Clostridia bacterium]
VISERFGGDYNNGRNYAYTEIGAACDDPERFLEEVRNELLFRLDSYYPEEEFERAKRVVYANGIFPLDSVEDTAMTCSSFWVMGEDYLRWPEAVMRVTREEAHRILRETVRLDRCSVSILRPKGGNGT